MGVMWKFCCCSKKVLCVPNNWWIWFALTFVQYNLYLWQRFVASICNLFADADVICTTNQGSEREKSPKRLLNRLILCTKFFYMKLAPRVKNSGHCSCSISECSSSRYEVGYASLNCFNTRFETYSNNFWYAVSSCLLHMYKWASVIIWIAEICSHKYNVARILKINFILNLTENRQQ